MGSSDIKLVNAVVRFHCRAQVTKYVLDGYATVVVSNTVQQSSVNFTDKGCRGLKIGRRMVRRAPSQMWDRVILNLLMPLSDFTAKHKSPSTSVMVMSLSSSETPKTVCSQ